MLPTRRKHFERGARRTIKMARVVFLIVFVGLLFLLHHVKQDLGSSNSSILVTRSGGPTTAEANSGSGVFCTHTITDNKEDGLFMNMLGVLSALSLYGQDIHIAWSNPKYLAPGR